MKQKEELSNSCQEITNRLICAKIGLTIEELNETNFAIEVDDMYQSYVKIIFEPESLTKEILPKIVGLNDSYWVLLDSL
jgi:hypothetical protein